MSSVLTFSKNVNHVNHKKEVCDEQFSPSGIKEKSTK